MKNYFQQIGIIIIVALVASYFGAAMAVTRVAPIQNKQDNTAVSTAATGSVTNTQEQQIIEAVKKTSPAVVSITISQNIPVANQNSQQIPGFPFNPFFGNNQFNISTP